MRVTVQRYNTSILKQALNTRHPATLYNDSFHSPNCVQTILNDPDLADTHWIFQHDCPPSMLEFNNLTWDYCCYSYNLVLTSLIPLLLEIYLPMVSTIEGFHCNTEVSQLTDVSWLKTFAIIFDCKLANIATSHKKQGTCTVIVAWNLDPSIPLSKTTHQTINGQFLLQGKLAIASPNDSVKLQNLPWKCKLL